jgi:hypothetical protein
VVLRITESLSELPIAQHSEVLAQETPKRSELPLGRTCGFHVLPPLVLTTTAALNDEFWPTAKQPEVLVQETP